MCPTDCKVTKILLMSICVNTQILLEGGLAYPAINICQAKRNRVH